MNFPNALPVKIILIGAGGTGGYILPHLYRIAYSLQRPVRIIVCDGDIVEQKNIVRQNFAPQDIGLNKAKALAERYSSAFGISCEYIPRFIESEEELLALTNPDCIEQKVVLIGAVDNNKSRQVCHRIFYRKPNLVYIDAGNGLYTGQVVCGLRKNGRTQSGRFPYTGGICERRPRERSKDGYHIQADLEHRGGGEIEKAAVRHLGVHLGHHAYGSPYGMGRRR